jgi:signal peptidase I
MEETTYQEDLRRLLRQVLERCPPDTACGELSSCLDSDDYDKIDYCCEAWQRAHENSFDWWARGAAAMQRGILYAREDAGRSDAALKALEKAENVLGICDDVCAALVLMARGRILESGERRVTLEGSDSWEEASQAYLKAREKLDRVGHPLATQAKDWWMEAVRRLRRGVRPARGEGAQPVAPDAGPAPEAQSALEDVSSRAESPAAKQETVEQVKPAGIGAEAGQPAAREETPPGGPTFLYPPAGRLRLMRVCENKVRAGEPVEMAIKMGEKLEALALDIGGTEFLVRGTPGRKDLDYLDAFDYALAVAGDSMEPVIHDGEYVLVSKAQRRGGTEGAYRKGEIVIARAPRGTEDEFTVKRYYPRSYQLKRGEVVTYILLKPENDAYAPIILLETDEQKQALEDHLRAEYGDAVILITAGTRGAIEGRVSVILSPGPPKQAGG